MFLYLFLTYIIAQRLVELYIANRNAAYIQALGGFEVEREHYFLIILMHIGFFVSFLIESIGFNQLPVYWYIPLAFFGLSQILRFWTIFSLGRFWNTRIFVIPNSKPIKAGPYRYIRHPNYLVVIIEMITIPLIFGFYYTALTFLILNAIMLSVRIKKEEKALAELTEYEKEMAQIPRFIPRLK